jgi:hypothetical protein
MQVLLEAHLELTSSPFYLSTNTACLRNPFTSALRYEERLEQRFSWTELLFQSIHPIQESLKSKLSEASRTLPFGVSWSSGLSRTRELDSSVQEDILHTCITPYRSKIVPLLSISLLFLLYDRVIER